MTYGEVKDFQVYSMDGGCIVARAACDVCGRDVPVDDVFVVVRGRNGCFGPISCQDLARADR